MGNKRRLQRVGAAFAVVFCALAPMTSLADLVNSLITVQVQSGQTVVSHTFDASGGGYNLQTSVEFRDLNGNLLGTLGLLTLATQNDPMVMLGFAVTAGAADTTFTITSATVGFAPLVSPDAFAVAAVTLTDSAADGATLTGTYGGKLYEANYNAAKTVFGHLIGGPVLADGENGAVAMERQPLTGRTTIDGTVDQMTSSFSFTLSALDQASGTSRFDIVPTEHYIPMPPAALSGLVFLAGMIAMRIRRKAA